MCHVIARKCKIGGATVANPFHSKIMPSCVGDDFCAKVASGRLEAWVGSMKFSCPAGSDCLRWDYEHDMETSLNCVPAAAKAFEVVQHFFPGSVMERIVGMGRFPREKCGDSATSPWRTALVGAGFA